MPTPTNTPSGLTAPERETVIQFDDDSDLVTIFTSQGKVSRKLFRLGFQPVFEYRNGTQITAQTFKIPVKMFRWNARGPKAMSEAQRLAARDRLAQARASKHTPKEEL